MSSRRVSTNTHNYQATNRKREEIGEVYILSFFAASAFKNVLKKFFSRNPKPKPKSSPNFVAKKKLTSALWTPSWFPKTRRTFVSYLSGDLSSVANNSKRLVFSRRRPLAPRRSFLSLHPGAGYSLTFAVVCLCTKKKKLKGSVQSVSSESSAEKTLALEAAACVRFSTFEGVFVIFQSQSHPDRRTKRTNFARVCKAKKKIDRADLLATTDREINSFFLERKYKTYPAISRLLPMRMQRNSSSFGRRDDETEDRKEIYLSILFFSNFSPLVLEKLYTRHHHAWLSQLEKERE